jgi:enoyl-[acyl-carrier protein] reductase I
MLMDGKVGIVMGIANNLSIAYGIAKKISEQGGKLILTYQGEALKKRIIPISQELNADLVVECDVSKPD